MNINWLYPKFKFNKLTDTRFSQIRETCVEFNTRFNLTDDTRRVTLVMCVLGFGIQLNIDNGKR